MFFPEPGVHKDGPVPSALLIWIVDLHFTPPERDQEVAQVYDRLMHQIPRETRWQWEDPAQTLKDAWLRNTSLASVFGVLVGACGREEELEIGLVLFAIWVANRVDVDVCVTRPTVVAVFGFKQRRVVMTGAWFVTAREIAHQPATDPRMVTG